MTVQALYSAATGMTSMETKLDVIANNLANMETTAFKVDRANFEDLFYNHEVYPGAQDTSGQYTPTGIAIGYGSRVSSVQTNFVQGAFRQTGEALDLAIEGRGFFQVLDPSSGETVYTRAGNFSINANGEIVMGSASTGRLLEPSITIPEDATNISISAEGIVSVKQPGSDGTFAGRPDRTGAVHQPRRAAEDGREPVLRDGRLGHGDAHEPRPGRRRD